MNILFVNYGDFTANSLNHIAGFANTLCAQGHATIVAVPQKKSTISAVPQALFIAALFDELLAQPSLFPNHQPADLIHAWTPREVVRKFVLAYQRVTPKPARLLIHLEDNEQFLLERFTGKSFEELRRTEPHVLAGWLHESLPHPVRYEAFLHAADGITHIVERLAAFAPPHVPTQLLPPGVDFSIYYPQPADEALRTEIGLKPGEKILTFTGSSTFANESDLRELYVAVALLNERGVPTRLVRTGIDAPRFLEGLPEAHKQFSIELGFVEKLKLPKLLALADVLVQPGQSGSFNDYRLPSKIPEFLAMGKPVILPPSNVAEWMTDGKEALFLKTGSPKEIADLCQRVFADPALAASLGEQGAALARRHFGLAANTQSLLEFVTAICARPSRTDWSLHRSGVGSEITLLAAQTQQLVAQTSNPSDRTSAANELAHDVDLLALLVRELEGSLEALRNSQVLKTLESDVAHWKGAYDLTKQHAENVDKTLTAARLHAANLDKVVQAIRVEQIETLANAQAARLQFEREAARLTKTIQQTENELVQIDDEFEQVRLRDHHLIFQRDEKISVMQDSFSWKATAWLRSLRRSFLDGKKKKEPRQPSALPARKTKRFAVKFGEVSAHVPDAPMFHFCIDYPTTWNFKPSKVLVRGWCFASDGTKLKDVRVRVGARVYQGVYGLKRLDVLAALRQFPQAEYCGFKLEIELGLTDKKIAFEALIEPDTAHRFSTHAIDVAEGGGKEDLTSYGKWVETYDLISPTQIASLRAKAESFAYRPLISVLVPVYNTPEQWLVKAIESVRNQVYPRWELCLADDASSAPHIRPLLERWAATDPRIKFVLREKNGHISASSNSALEIATGEFTALLDHDDELAPHALYEVVAALNKNANYDLLYSDEDKIDEEGRRLEPYFKPDFLPDLFVGQNYTSHLSVYRTSVMRAVGGFRPGFEGSQDWDLALRVIDLIGIARVHHISRILYHWRAIPGSTAFLLSEKNYPVEAARRALAEHFARKNEAVEIVPVPGDHWRIKRPLPKEPPRVSLIIPTRNGLSLLRRCIESITTLTRYPNYEIIVVDNQSDDSATLAYFVELKQKGIRVINFPQTFNYSAINNYAVREASGTVIGLLNNDLEVIDAEWLTEMVSQACRPEIGCVGAMLYYPNDHIQHAGVIVGLGGVAGHAFRDLPRGTEGKFNRARLVQNYTVVTAACLVIRKEIYQKVGGLDEKDLKIAFNDVDFCLKVRAAGYWNLWTPFAELYHHESASRGADDTPEKHERFRFEVETMMARWPEQLRRDPAYNANLTLELNDFSLAARPRIEPLSI